MPKLSTLLVPLTILAAAFLPTLALAGDGSGIAAGDQGMVALGAGVAIGFAALGCGVGQGLAALGALQGIARNPSASGKIQTPMIICLALIESLCIYALVIAFFLQGKI
jgi:F-type H+-transporting ATPase subunit c